MSRSPVNAIDLFAGAGGWDEGIAPLGVRPVGIEWDENACATREAAGHWTVRGDVAAYDPREFMAAAFLSSDAPVDLLIASPPCQAFSVAGKRGGETDLPGIYACLADLAAGIDRRAEYRARCSDERSLLVVEPFRWALALRPRFIALEQVTPVLDLWRWIAHELAKTGYHTWAGLLSAERYGVPQTRVRAFLMASLDRVVYPPMPTHQRYEPGVPAEEQHTLEGTLRPWVSMAEALGWGMTERPTHTVTAGGTGSGGPEPFAAGERSLA